MLNRVHPGTLRDAADDRTGFRRGSTYALNAFPTVYVHRLAADLRFYADNNIVFAQYDCVTGHWGRTVSTTRSSRACSGTPGRTWTPSWRSTAPGTRLRAGLP